MEEVILVKGWFGDNEEWYCDRVVAVCTNQKDALECKKKLEEDYPEMEIDIVTVKTNVYLG